MRIHDILQLAIKNNVSDVLIKSGATPRFRKSGVLLSASNIGKITAQWVDSTIAEILPSRLRDELIRRGDADFSYKTANFRFRVNLFKQKGSYAFSIRVIKSNIPSSQELMLPKNIDKLVELKRGIVLICGPTGSGKSTTLAYLIEQINRQKAYHIITVEDPIEYDFMESMSTINQREIGEDCLSFSDALRAGLRQDPDVIMVGELRDKETVQTALKAAETGHLIFSTLHTADCMSTITRILSYFDSHLHHHIKSLLGANLQGIISQRMIASTVNKKSVCAFEIMMMNKMLREKIPEADDFAFIEDVIKQGKSNYGMLSFDDSIMSLYRSNDITEKEALKASSSKSNFKLKLKGVG